MQRNLNHLTVLCTAGVLSACTTRAFHGPTGEAPRPIHAGIVEGAPVSYEVNTGARQTFVFHWTENPAALTDAKTYVRELVQRAVAANSASQPRELPEDAVVGHGLYAAGDPLQTAGAGRVLVVVPIKERQRALKVEQSPARAPNADARFRAGLSEFAHSPAPLIVLPSSADASALSINRVVVRDVGTVDLSAIEAFDGRSVKSFAQHAPLGQTAKEGRPTWHAALKNYLDLSQFMQDYFEAPELYRTGDGKLTDHAAVAGIFAELIHGAPGVQEGFDTLLASAETAAESAPRCASDMEHARRVGLVENLHSRTSCKLALRRILEIGLPGAAQGAFKDDAFEKTYLGEAVALLRASGFLGTADRPQSASELTKAVVGKWRAAGSAARAEEFMEGLESLRAELSTWNVDKWTRLQVSSLGEK